MRKGFVRDRNHLQMELIKRNQANAAEAKPRDGRVSRGIHLSINRIAAGLRNIG